MFAVINGEKSHAGHWNQDDLLVRMLERLNWYDPLDFFAPDVMAQKLIPDLLRRIHDKKKEQNMSVSEKYYDDKLYPLQNGVLSLVQKAETPFFLTSGTGKSHLKVL